MFIVLCIGIVLYLGFKMNVSLLDFDKEHIKYELFINEIMTNNRSSIRDDEGDFEDWIEVYNKGDIAIDLNGFGLSNDPKQPFLWTFPNTIIEPKSFCIVWISGKNKSNSDNPLHTSFKFSSKDKVIMLTAPNNNWSDIFVLEPIEENISYGRRSDGTSELYGFDEGTPGKSNTNDILINGPNAKRVESPFFSHNGGFYTESFNLILKINDVNAEIYYTLDGSIPTKETHHYTEPILIPLKTDEATVVRARTYKDGYPKSKIITESYFVQKNIYDNYNIPVISLVTDPANLFDYEKGIYIAGKVFDQWKMDNPNSEINRMSPANYNQRGKNWERETSVELFEPDGILGLSQNIGIRVHGGTSRVNNLKSLSLLARKDYDDKEYFDYDFFEGKAMKIGNNEKINRFSQVLLRTSATDSKYSLFRDALMQSLIQNLGILDTQSSNPCIVYINGQYYGIHNIREAYDKNYISNNYDMNPKDVVIIKNPTGYPGVEIQEGYVGDEMHYNRVIQYIKEYDIKIDSKYNFIKTKIDIENFIEYNILQIYCDNDDWPGNNVRIWRKRTETYDLNALYGHDGRWRWMVFDLDHGFGLYQGEKAAQNNSLERATEENGPVWPNPPWSTLLLRSLLENDEFKNQFINTFADRLNTIFLPQTVISQIETMEKRYYPNIISHIVKWELHNKDIGNWNHEVKDMKNFAMERPKYMRQHIVDYFGISGTAKIQVEMNKGGIVKINSLAIEHTDTPWEGIYFKSIPITLEAVPSAGFTFVGWEGINKSQDKTITINLSQSSYLKAVFKRDKGD